MGSSAFKQYVYHYDKQGQKKSIPDSYRDPTRYLKTSNQKESMMEKPYLTGDYKRMHLAPPPDSEYKPDDWWPPIPDTNLPLWVSGKKQFVTHTIIWGDPFCNFHAMVGGCLDPGETIDFNTFVTGGFSKDNVKTTSKGSDIGTINDDGTFTMGDDAGTAVICSSFEAEIPGRTVLTAAPGTMPAIPFPFPTDGIGLAGGSSAFNRSDSNRKVSIDCGCNEIESCTADEECGGAESAVDTGTTPQTIAKNDNVTVTFTSTPPEGCSCGPYDWSIEYPPGTPDQYGKGFSVDSAQTETPAVGVTTSSGDGVGIVVMTDQCGNSMKYELRCTEGKWWSCANNGPHL